MERFERLAFPLIALVALAGFFLMRAGEGTVVMIARVAGITLLALMIAGFIARSIVKVRRAKERQAALLSDLERERDRLMAELGGEEKPSS